jgi:ATP/maltotriose-dependent transcriptional regulator MalT
MATHQLAQVAVARGQRTQAIGLLQRSLRMAEHCWLEPHAVVRILGTLVAATANPRAAVRRAEDADCMLDRRSVCPPCSIGFQLAAAIAHARAGHPGQARRRLQAAERLAGMWPGGAWQAATWETHAVPRQAEGDLKRAAALYDEVADRFADLGRPLDRDRCRTAARHIAGATTMAAHPKA